MKNEDMHIALGLPPPPAGEMGDADGDESGDDETAENDAIDAMFEETDPAARRELFKKAVELCKGGGY